ncbi:MAG: aminoglycoside phosphotransferase family protein [Myxococcota bacterium]
MDAVRLSMPDAVRQWVEQTCGPFEIVEQRSAATRIQTKKATVWVKRYRSGRAWAQSERAFGIVVPSLARSGVAVPERLAQQRSLKVRLLHEVPGRPVTLDDPPEVFAQAARVLARIHRIPCAQEALSLGEAMAQRATAWAVRPGAPPVGQAIVDWVVAHREALDALRVWCHRDYLPQNWLFHHGALGLLDFEHTRPDHPLVDWVRLEAWPWSEAQRAAFVEVLGEPDADALRGNLAIYGLATWVWARDRRDVDLTAVGRRALERAGFPP